MLDMRFTAEWCHRASQKAVTFANATNEFPRFVLVIIYMRVHKLEVYDIE